MELGATVCTPRAPACLACPVMKLCVTRGELAASVQPPRQKKQEIHCVLNLRSSGQNAAVLLVQRPPDARLMASMWELPEIPSPRNHSKPAFTLRHSITNTDYRAQVWHSAAPDGGRGQWIPARRLRKLALTGLARKILRKAGAMVGRLSNTL